MLLPWISSPVDTKPNVLNKDKTADTFPFDRAVNIAEVKIFNPQNKKLYANIEKPFTAN